MQFSLWRFSFIVLVVFHFCAASSGETLKRVEISDFGKIQDGSEVKLITLRNANGMSAQIITYGAIIKELSAPDRDGNFTNILLTTDTLQKFQRFGGAAAVIGRVA